MDTKTPDRALVAALIKAQAIAGSLFFVFLLLHLGNTLLAPFGAETYNQFQRAVRGVYQQPIIELLLVIGPLVTHAIAGIWLYLLRKKRRINKPWRYRAQSWAGLFLLLVVFGHVLATRGISYWYGPFAEFGGVAFSLWWVPGYFYPYYFLLFMAGLYHSTMGVHSLLRRRGLVRSERAQQIPGFVALLGAVGIMLALLSFGGLLFDIHDPRDSDYARLYAELFDVNLLRPWH